jgi:hypothetical protein
VGINISHSLQMRVFHYIKLLEMQGLLELRELFQGGPYMRKYGNFGDIGWPPQPPRERVPKINKKVGF